jgi:hypothetical protein
MPARQQKRRRAPRRAAAGTRTVRRRWSGYVTKHSNAMDLESSVFRRSPREIARSLKRSVERSTRLKSTPFRSAMSMLTFYENRAGRNLSLERKQAIHQAKDELRKLFGRPTRGARR